MQLTNAETVTGMALSPNGRYAALASKYRDELADADVARLQIIDLDNNKTVQHTVGQAAASLAWSPDGKMLAVGSTSSLWLHDLDSGALRPLVLEKDGLGAWRWHPDSGSILFGWTSRDDTDIDKRKRLQSLEDRWAGFRDKSQIYQADVSSGLVRPLTAGEQSVRLHDVRGKRLLLSSAVIDYSEPPHSKTRLFELDTDSAEEREIAQIREFADIRFADDGYWLLAGPSLAIGDGDVTSDGLTANVYDTQLYRLSADGDSATSVSREFDPALGSVERLADGSLLLSATAGAGTALVHFDPEEQAWTMPGGWPAEAGGWRPPRGPPRPWCTSPPKNRRGTCWAAGRKSLRILPCRRPRRPPFWCAAAMPTRRSASSWAGWTASAAHCSTAAPARIATPCWARFMTGTLSTTTAWKSTGTTTCRPILMKAKNTRSSCITTAAPRRSTAPLPAAIRSTCGPPTVMSSMSCSRAAPLATARIFQPITSMPGATMPPMTSSRAPAGLWTNMNLSTPTASATSAPATAAS